MDVGLVPSPVLAELVNFDDVVCALLVEELHEHGLGGPDGMVDVVNHVGFDENFDLEGG